MFKATKDGIEKSVELPPLSDEDMETILEMFEEYQEFGYLGKEEGVWKPRNFTHER